MSSGGKCRLAGQRVRCLPNAPSKISVPFINSAPGKNCLVPVTISKPTGTRRVRAAKSDKANNKEASNKKPQAARFAAHFISDHSDRSYNSNATSGVKNFPD